MKELSRRVKIMVCADGFVSILERPSDRRLGAALPVHSTDTVEEAFILIQRVCTWGRCAHGGKVGTLIEPKAPHWPDDAATRDIDRLAEVFQLAEREMYGDF